MKFKRLFQVTVMLMLITSSLGSSQPASAHTESSFLVDPVVVDHDLTIWDAIYIGFVSSGMYEKWHFDLTETHTFEVTASPIAGTGEFVPLLILQDADGAEIARGSNTLTSTQGAGSYSIQVQPEVGSGIYLLTLREALQAQPSSTAVVTPASVNLGESAVVTINLNDVPVAGYTSAEFTCTYAATFIEVSSIAATSLFGADPALAIHGPQGGSFIVAIAGSNVNKATSSGAAFTFHVTGLQAGQTNINCTARVSAGNNVLTPIPSTGTALTVVGATPTATSTSTPTQANTASPTSSTPTETATPTATGSTPTSTATATVTGIPPTQTATSMPTSTSTPTSTPVALPTATSTSTATPAPTNGNVMGTVLASKPVTVSLYDAANTLVTSVAANPAGTFSLKAPSGTYSLRATASGFLSALGPVVISAGGSTSMPTIRLLAGDIDSNNVIDQLDALTIGMSYNTNNPAAADLNNDNTINVLDLEALAENYRTTGPTAWGVSYP